MKESIIQQQICNYLSAVGVFYFSILNETAIMILKMFHIPDAVSYRIVSFLKKMGLLSGMTDICILANNTCYFLEVKNETGKPSKRQLIIHKALTDKGYKVAIVRSVEDVRHFLIKENIIKGVF